MAKPRHFVVGIVALALILFICTTSQVSSLLYPAYSQTAASVTHTVLFQFSAKAKADDVKAACDRFLALKESCIHPTKQAPYIVSLKGGKDNSPEGLQGGITHGFVVEFASTEDRDYYVKTDPSHQAFIKSIGDLVDKAVVVDFSNEFFHTFAEDAGLSGPIMSHSEAMHASGDGAFGQTHIVEPLKQHTHTAIVLHGRGSTGEEFADEILSSKLSDRRTLPQRFPGWRWVFPSSRTV